MTNAWLMRRLSRTLLQLALCAAAVVGILVAAADVILYWQGAVK